MLKALAGLIRLASAFAVLGSAGAVAQEVEQLEMIDLPEGTTGLGFGFRTGTSIYKGEGAQPLDVVPLYLYEGKHLFARGTYLGGHLFNKEMFTLDAVARYDFTELDPTDDAYFAGLQPREQTWEAGLQSELRGDWGAFRLGYFRDVGSEHKGGELDMAYRYRIRNGNWIISPFVAGSWMDSSKTGYYYGVSAAEATSGRPAYSPGGSLSVELGLNTRYQVTDHLFLFGNAGVRRYGSEVTDSPLVDKSTDLSAYFGAAYLFSDGLNRPIGQWAGIRDWSWRVNYGVQSDRKIFPEPMAGQVGRGDEGINTNVAGFTLGKIVQHGERFDFWAKVAAFRQFEEPLQDDFWSFSAYITAMGKGYSPWSDQLLFRYGVSMGLNYAQEVPIVEQVKQRDRGENTSQLLNYLEFQVDFPVDRWIKSRVTNGCFLGMTLVHRSGIFGWSDIIGSVAGGSDWATVSYECVR